MSSAAGVHSLVARLYVAAVIGEVLGPELPAQGTGNGPISAQFRYTPGDHHYIFNGSTKNLPEGYYRLRIDLGDGMSRTVPVELN